MPSSSPISLICLAPEPQCSNAFAQKLGADLAYLLNCDEGLPEGIRNKQESPSETSETILSYTREWCIKKNAIFFAIVLYRQQAIGSISLSHLDYSNHSAFCGYWLGSAHQRQGYGTEAVVQTLTVAQAMGLVRVSATIQDTNVASRRIWEKLGACFQISDNKVKAMIDLGNS